MALGGGAFLTQDKIIPGSYINFVSTSRANAALSDRGVATMPLELDWGVEGQVFKVNSVDFQKDSLKIFGYEFDHEKMKGLRELFKNIHTLYAYRLNSGGIKATNTYATAKYAGTRGNDIKIIVKKNVDDEHAFDVITTLGSETVDKQTVKLATELIDNNWVTFKKEASLEITAGVPLAGGTNKDITGTEHSDYLAKIESYSFNAIGVVTTEESIKSLYAAFVKRMREEVGAKFQAVIHNMPADYIGVINLKNKCKELEAGLVYWVTGIVAGCAVNKSNLNKTYDGEFTVDADYTQTQLERAIQNGEFVLHYVGSDVRVLEDINSMVTTSDAQGDVFKDNQTIRVIDQIANDIANLFTTKYLGKVPNDSAGRTSLWSDIVKHHEALQNIRAIEGFTDKDVTIDQGNDKKSVVVNDAITVVNTLAKLYMTVTVA
nr:MAG TPA: tail sheath protein [Caudoviricetes sp.]